MANDEGGLNKVLLSDFLKNGVENIANTVLFVILGTDPISDGSRLFYGSNLRKVLARILFNRLRHGHSVPRRG